MDRCELAVRESAAANTPLSLAAAPTLRIISARCRRCPAATGRQVGDGKAHMYEQTGAFERQRCRRLITPGLRPGDQPAASPSSARAARTRRHTRTCVLCSRAATSLAMPELARPTVPRTSAHAWNTCGSKRGRGRPALGPSRGEGFSACA